MGAQLGLDLGLIIKNEQEETRVPGYFLKQTREQRENSYSEEFSGLSFTFILQLVVNWSRRPDSFVVPC